MGLLDRFRRDEVEPEHREHQARSSSGRSHSSGFLDLEELNNELRHPQGHRIYDLMYRGDGDVRQIVALATNPIISGTWDVFPYGGDAATEKDILAAKVTRWALFDCMKPALTDHLQQFLPVLVRSGFAPGEKVWGVFEYDGKEYLVPKTIGLRLPRTIERWYQDVNGELEKIVQMRPIVPHVTSDDNHGGYVDLPARDLVYYRVGAEGDNWEGVSMLRPAYKHWKLKDAIERIDAVAQEREAIGIPICYPPPSASASDLEEMEEILANMRANEAGYIIMPGQHAQDLKDGGGGWRLELLGFNRQGSGRDPQPSLLYHTGKIAAAFISEFMQLGHRGEGARATAQVQANPFMDAVESLAGLVEGVLNEQLVAPFCAYNFEGLEGPPRLQMSLIDSTSLTQLAEFVAKLVQVGALVPDQRMEDFLRERAELPPPDPDAVQARAATAKKDVESRKEVIVGGPGYGAHAPPGADHEGKGVPKRDSATAADRGSDGSTSLDRDDADAVVLQDPPEDAIAVRPRRRELQGAEIHIDLDAIEDELDGIPDRFRRAVQDHLMRIARAGLYARQNRKKLPPELRSSIRRELSDVYSFGRQTVREEVDRQLQTLAEVYPHVTLARADDDERHLDAMTDYMLETILDGMDSAARYHQLANATDATVQLAAEGAAQLHLRQQAQGHGMYAFNAGRVYEADKILEAGDVPIGVRYNALLDKGTCSHCERADDGVVRPLDDPVRLDRRPPNRHCESTGSGRNMCRCFETYEVTDA